MNGVWVALGTLALAVVLGLAWQARQGRIRRGVTALPSAVRACLDEAGPYDGLTLLMLSAPMCARCPQARAVLDELVTTIHPVRRLELDLGAHPAVARDLGVRSTPTTLAISRSGHELARVIGVPRRSELLETLTPHL
ncbi:MAG: thioredoxin [Pseudonocardiaceae bacterium]|nr:thioredoxin [Pseudonocardiaceae bacterium]